VQADRARGEGVQLISKTLELKFCDNTPASSEAQSVVNLYTRLPYDTADYNNLGT